MILDGASFIRHKNRVRQITYSPIRRHRSKLPASHPWENHTTRMGRMLPMNKTLRVHAARAEADRYLAGTLGQSRPVSGRERGQRSWRMWQFTGASHDARVARCGTDELGYMNWTDAAPNSPPRSSPTSEGKNSIAVASNESFSGWTKSAILVSAPAFVDRLTFNGNHCQMQ